MKAHQWQENLQNINLFIVSAKASLYGLKGNYNTTQIQWKGLKFHTKNKFDVMLPISTYSSPDIF